MWVKLDDAFFTDQAAMAAGPEGRLLFLAGLCHASRNLTDGAIDKRALQSIAALAGAEPEVADLLVDLGLWTDEGSFYNAPKYLAYNPPADKVRADREAAANRMAAKRSADVPANFGGTSGPPSRSRPTTPSSSSTVSGTGLPEGLWRKVAEKQATRTTSTITDHGAWVRKAMRNAEHEHTERACWLWENYTLTESQLVDLLIGGGSPLEGLRRKDSA